MGWLVSQETVIKRAYQLEAQGNKVIWTEWHNVNSKESGKKEPLKVKSNKLGEMSPYLDVCAPIEVILIHISANHKNELRTVQSV